MVALSELLKDTFVLLGALRWMLEKKPPQTLERFSLSSACLTPLFHADFVHSGVECLDDVKTIEDECCIRAIVFDSADVGLAHVAAGPFDFLLLVVTEHFIEEGVYGFSFFALADPDHTCTF